MGEIQRLWFLPSRWLGFSVFPWFLPLGNGVFHSFIVEAVGFKDQLLRIQEFRLKPCPCNLFCSHAMVFEKSASCKGYGSKDAHPAHFLAPHKGAQSKVDAHRYTHRQKGAEKLPGGEAEKDGLLVIPYFLWHFYFYNASLLPAHRPKISFTMRSLIRTAPTRTSRLKTSSPT